MLLGEALRLRSNTLTTGGVILVNGVLIECSRLDISMQNLVENGFYIGTAVSFTGTVSADPLGNVPDDWLAQFVGEQSEQSNLYVVLQNLLRQMEYRVPGVPAKLSARLDPDIKQLPFASNHSEFSTKTLWETLLGGLLDSTDAVIRSSMTSRAVSPSETTYPNTAFASTGGIGSSVVLIPAYQLWVESLPVPGGDALELSTYTLASSGLVAKYPYLVSDVQLNWSSSSTGPKTELVITGSYIVNLKLLGSFGNNEKFNGNTVESQWLTWSGCFGMRRGPRLQWVHCGVTVVNLAAGRISRRD